MKPPVLPQLELMRSGVDYSFPIRLRKFTFQARPLSTVEVISIAQEVADDLAKDQRPSGVTESLMIATAQLEKASTPDPETNTPALSREIMNKMTPQEIDHLWKQYLAGVARANPSLEELPLATIEALVAEVKKNPQIGEALIELSFLELVSISRHLIQTASPPANSSG